LIRELQTFTDAGRLNTSEKNGAFYSRGGRWVGRLLRVRLGGDTSPEAPCYWGKGGERASGGREGVEPGKNTRHSCSHAVQVKEKVYFDNPDERIRVVPSLVAATSAHKGDSRV